MARGRLYRAADTSRDLEVQAYRGYLVCWNVLNGLWWVEKDGQRICYAQGADDARATIDRLLD